MVHSPVQEFRGDKCLCSKWFASMLAAEFPVAKFKSSGGGDRSRLMRLWSSVLFDTRRLKIALIPMHGVPLFGISGSRWRVREICFRGGRKRSKSKSSHGGWDGGQPNRN